MVATVSCTFVAGSLHVGWRFVACWMEVAGAFAAPWMPLRGGFAAGQTRTRQQREGEEVHHQKQQEDVHDRPRKPTRHLTPGPARIIRMFIVLVKGCRGSGLQSDIPERTVIQYDLSHAAGDPP